MPSNPLEPAPLVSPTQTVIEDWIDYNGHLNMAFYNVIFDRAVDHFYDLLGVGAKYAESGAGSCFTMEIHVHYLNEVSLDDELELHLQLLDYDSKRLHYFTADVPQRAGLSRSHLRATRAACGFEHAPIRSVSTACPRQT